MNGPRQPASFRIEPDNQQSRVDAPSGTMARPPRAIDPGSVAVMPAMIDVFVEPDEAVRIPPPAVAPKRRSRLGAIFLGAFGILVSLAAGLWADRLIRELFQRA